ncbi:MAG: hypothetical protein RLZZ505_2446 [Verrucomicrobiota bacterium]|jgi:hypothetical protein
MKAIPATFVLFISCVFHCAADKEALKQIGAAVGRIEAGYQDWPRFSASAGNMEGGGGFERHIWLSDDDSGLLRAEVTYFTERGIVGNTFYARGDALLHVLDRAEETPMEEGAATDVIEKRFDFAGETVIRCRIKQAEFAEGEEADTAGIAGREIEPSDLEGAGELYGGYQAILHEIIAELDPEKGAPTPGGPAVQGEGWRLIEGTRSRDGNFGIAWGIQGKAQPDGETDEDGFMSVDPESEGLANYVVNLRSGTVLGKTAGTHFGDKGSYNHDSTEVAWSASSLYFVQVSSGKWATYDANVYGMAGDQMSVSPPVDLLEPAKKAAFGHLEGGDLLEKFDRDDFAITLSEARIVWRGASPYVVCEVNGQIPKSEEEDAYFGLTVTFRLDSGESDGASALVLSGTEAHPE